MTATILIDGVRRDALPDEVDFPTPPSTPEPPLALVQVACARLEVDGWSVTGIERSQGIAGAFMIAPDTLWVMFSDPQPDSNYIVIPDDGVTKYPDMVEVSRSDLAEALFIIQRVQ